MPPVVLVLGIGNQRRIAIPLPLFLLWPLVALAWLALTLCQAFVRTGGDAGRAIAAGKQALTIFGRLSGLRIDVQSKDGSGVYIQVI